MVRDRDRKEKQVKLRETFSLLQSQMMSALSVGRKVIKHPGAKGESAELSWLQMLTKYLPARYQAEKAFVIDSAEQISDAIDIVIFDRQYSPFLLKHSGVIYVPAESVYCVLESKQAIGRREIRYAGLKVQSVRRLKRTSVPIPSAGGTLPPKELHTILGGLVGLQMSWNQPFGTSFLNAIGACKVDCRVDFGCTLEDGAFSLKYNADNGGELSTWPKEEAIVGFFFQLLERLQRIATVPAIDIAAYGKALKGPSRLKF